MADLKSTPEIVRQIMDSLATLDLTEEQVSSVLATWNHLREGDPIGMVRRDPDTGSVAHRVSAEGVHIWRVSRPDGEQYNDMQPTLPWPVLPLP